jgi:uncharacterized protein YdhG (YjbR/CyaY superfamily)
MSRKPKDIDAYLASLPADRRAALSRLRKAIRTLAPGTEECISYGLPAFRLYGQVVAGFAGTSKGCSYYPFSGRTLATLAAALEAWSRTKSAIHFTAERPLPVALLGKLLRARIAEIRER